MRLNSLIDGLEVLEISLHEIPKKNYKRILKLSVWEWKLVVNSLCSPLIMSMINPRYDAWLLSLGKPVEWGFYSTLNRPIWIRNEEVMIRSNWLRDKHFRVGLSPRRADPGTSQAGPGQSWLGWDRPRSMGAVRLAGSVFNFKPS